MQKNYNRQYLVKPVANLKLNISNLILVLRKYLQNICERESCSSKPPHLLPRLELAVQLYCFVDVKIFGAAGHRTGRGQLKKETNKSSPELLCLCKYFPLRSHQPVCPLATLPPLNLPPRRQFSGPPYLLLCSGCWW